MARYLQGKFKPKHPEKYKGDPTNIVYRSSWELKFCSYLDSHPNVIKWASEEFCIPYMSPIDNRVHRYFPDFYVKKRNTYGEIDEVVIEVKPDAQTKAPKKKSKVTKRYINEVKTYGINQAKWNAANNYCKSKGWKFTVITEKDLGLFNGRI